MAVSGDNQLDVRGIYSAPNEVTRPPIGALKDALDVDLSAAGSATPRKGFTPLFNILGSTIMSVFRFDGQADSPIYFAVDSAGALWYVIDVGGTPVQITGVTCLTDPVDVRPLFVHDAAIIPTTAGLQVIEVTSASDVLISPLVLPPPMPFASAWDAHLATSTIETIVDDKVFKIRAVLTRTFPDGQKMVSNPSSEFQVLHQGATEHELRVKIRLGQALIDAAAAVEDRVSISLYATEILDGISAASLSSEYTELVATTRAVTNDEFAAGEVSIRIVSFERGAALFTNNALGGANQLRTRTLQPRVLAYYRGRMCFGDVLEPATAVLRLVHFNSDEAVLSALFDTVRVIGFGTVDTVISPTEIIFSSSARILPGMQHLTWSNDATTTVAQVPLVLSATDLGGGLVRVTFSDAVTTPTVGALFAFVPFVAVDTFAISTMRAQAASNNWPSVYRVGTPTPLTIDSDATSTLEYLTVDRLEASGGSVFAHFAIYGDANEEVWMALAIRQAFANINEPAFVGRDALPTAVFGQDFENLTLWVKRTSRLGVVASSPLPAPDATDGHFYVYTIEPQRFKNRSYFAEQNQAGTTLATSFRSTGSNTSEIVQLLPVDDALLQLKADGLFRISGDDPITAVAEEVDRSVRCVSPRGAVAVGNVAAIASTRGLLLYYKGRLVELSSPIRDIWEDYMNAVPASTLRAQLSLALLPDEKRLFIGFPTADSDIDMWTCEYGLIDSEDVEESTIRFGWSRYGRSPTAMGHDEETGELLLAEGEFAYVQRGVADIRDDGEAVVATVGDGLITLTGVQPEIGDRLFNARTEVITEVTDVQGADIYVDGDFEVGDEIEVRIPFMASIRWWPMFAGAPMHLKQFTYFSAYLRELSLNTLTFSFSTDWSAAEEPATITPVSNSLGFGLDPFGLTPFGGTSLAPGRPFRQGIPRATQLGTRISAGMDATMSGESFILDGLALESRRISPTHRRLA